MDTNLNSPVQKKVVSVEILHLDEMGYGPQGEHTRRHWREECLEFIRRGSDTFKNWQEKILRQLTDEYKIADFGCYLQFENEKVRADVVGAHNFSSPSLIPGNIPRYSLDFSGYEFDTELSFFEYVFILPVIFSWTKFHNWVSFANSTFRKNADFLGVKFLRHVHFTDSNFLNFTNFNNAYFGEYADFSGSSFQENSLFNNIEFKGSANFSRVRFDGQSVFNETNFDSLASFIFAEFNERISFQGVIFNILVGFRNAKFNQQCEFQNIFNSNLNKWMPETIFNGHADFENATFKNVGHFERVQFTKYIPSFLGVDTATTRLEFSGDNYFTKNDISEDAIKRLGSLKRLADEHGQTDQALMFNAFELRAKAKQPNAGSILKITTNLYEKLSDYGRSFAKPIFWYGMLICLSALFAMIYSTYSDSPPQDQQVLCRPIKDQPPPLKLPYGRAVVEYAMFRAGGLMDFTDTGKQNNAVNCRLFEEPIEPPLMRAWGIFKGIASIALLFLAALGLRNKYRIK
jgi:hypothetical protein